MGWNIPDGTATVGTQCTDHWKQTGDPRESLLGTSPQLLTHSFILFFPPCSVLKLVGFVTVKQPNRQRLGDVQ